MTVREFRHGEFRILWLRVRRPRLAAGVASGILTYITLFMVSSIAERLLFILSWDVGVFVAMLALYIGLKDALPDGMKRIAAHQDAGKWAVLLLTLVAAGASLFAIAGQVPLIKTAAGVSEKATHIILIIATIVLSWAFVHTVFALHYAHDYYADQPTLTGVGAQNNGLAFPGEASPTYLDFAYFSFTIGMTFQVSDVQITDPRLRRLALMHGIISFFYSIGILALTINMVAGVI